MDPLSEFDHYCWISCDEEYEEMRTERAVTRTEEQRMEFCRETTNDSKEGRSKKRMERWKIEERPKLRTEEIRKDDDKKSQRKDARTRKTRIDQM